MTEHYHLHPIGVVESPLTDRSAAPLQGHEGAPDATLVMREAMTEGVRDLRPGADLIVLTWLHEAHREVLSTRPRSDPQNPIQGVFSTRSPDRPNPIGLHRVQIVNIEGNRIRVRDLEAIDGTPVIDIKPVIDPRER
ncbi:MAG: tRNA (N6-threonylcarbamoyladenosine(37)-N6)-methyltransferase TrmO [Solirubrobacteraceae bacterium]